MVAIGSGLRCGGEVVGDTATDRMRSDGEVGVRVAATAAVFAKQHGEATPGPQRWGRAAPWKMQGSGSPSPSRGFPNSREVLPGSSFHEGVLSGETTWIPEGIGAPKVALRWKQTKYMAHALQQV